MNNHILVTGASGNIGSALTQELAAAGAQFSVMTSNTQSEVQANRRIANFDDVASLTQAFAAIDTLFLVFPLVPHKLELARNAAQAAKAAGVKHIVRSSGAGADAQSTFALPKLQGQIDEILSATGIPFTFLRPAGFMQNYVSYQSQTIKDGKIFMADGGQSQSLIDTRDIASVAAKVLMAPTEHQGKAYTLTGGESFNGEQAAQMISLALGKSVEHISISTEAARDGMKQWGMPEYIIEVMDSLNQIVSAGYASGVSPDVQNLLGRAPRTFRAFVADAVQHWK